MIRPSEVGGGVERIVYTLEVNQRGAITSKLVCFCLKILKFCGELSRGHLAYGGGGEERIV